MDERWIKHTAEQLVDLDRKLAGVVLLALREGALLLEEAQKRELHRFLEPLEAALSKLHAVEDIEG